jgi:hypothetical protein
VGGVLAVTSTAGGVSGRSAIPTTVAASGPGEAKVLSSSRHIPGAGGELIAESALHLRAQLRGYRELAEHVGVGPVRDADL